MVFQKCPSGIAVCADGNLAELNITGKKLEETFNINYIHKT
jgi:hypothetical protein